MRKIILLLLINTVVLLYINAVIATPYPITQTQSDGSVIQYYLRGNEHFSYRTTLDGDLLTQVENGDLKMASVEEIDAFQQQQQQQIKYAADNGSQTRSNYPLNGSPKSLVILVEFSDKQYITPNPKDAFSALLNEPGYSVDGAIGSARDYFIAASHNQFTPNFHIVGPYVLPQSMSYYGGNDGAGYDKNARQMIIDACRLANDDINFSDFDTNSDGKVDNVFVYYAGHNEAEGANKNTIWPHRSSIGGAATFDGVKIFDYACTSELRQYSGSNMCGIGTFVHEFGHVLGLPDLYVTYGQSSHPTLGKWDVMDAGPYNNNGKTPPTYSSYQRFYLGWLKPEILTDKGQYILEPLLLSNKAYIVANKIHNLDGKNPNPVEFFMIENRQRVDWDQYAIPGVGMLVQHIVYNERTWENNTPNNNKNAMGVSIVRADGSTNNLAGDTYPGSDKVRRCELMSRNGDVVGNTIVSIMSIANNISFVYGELGPNDPYIEAKNELITFSSFVDEQTEIQKLRIEGRKLSKSLNVNFETQGALFVFALEEDGNYVEQLEIQPNVIDSTIDIELYIRCTPKVMTYNKEDISFLKVESEEFRFSYPLMWKCPRPIYIVPPTANEATEVTPYSFIANWDTVFDATAYYIYVYNENGKLLREFTTKDNSILINNFEEINPDSKYSYRVKATDRDFELDRYNNVTAFSNEILLQTISGFPRDDKKITIQRTESGSYVCFLPNYFNNMEHHAINDKLLIYNIRGVLIAEVDVTANVVELPVLESGHVYIVKHFPLNGDNSNPKNIFSRDTKVVKFYYQ